MTPLIFTLLTFASSIVAGALGALLGLGGGIIVIPVLTLFLHVNMRYAIGASIVSVIATSSGAAAAYVRERMTNLRVAMLLEIGTASGALTGAFIAGKLNVRWLYIIFGLMLAYSAVMMLKRRHHDVAAQSSDWLSRKLRLNGSYFDQAEKRQIDYTVTRSPLGLVLMYVAGIVSGLLGIGSGALKVPAMDLAMRMPLKASTATSNFMIGVTAAASAGVYFARGDIDPFIAAPVAAGVLLGATVGALILPRLHSTRVRAMFVVVLLYISGKMLWSGWRL